jgi:hypothetical protein
MPQVCIIKLLKGGALKLWVNNGDEAGRVKVLLECQGVGNMWVESLKKIGVLQSGEIFRN